MSESKFQAHPADFIPHILKKDRQALGDLIYKPAVERALLNRLGKKASIYGADIGPDGERVRRVPSRSPADGPKALPARSPLIHRDGKPLPKADSPLSTSGTLVDEELDQYEMKIDVEEVKHLYEKWIIPLTKEVEVSPPLRRTVLLANFHRLQVEYLLHRLDGVTQEEVDALLSRDSHQGEA